MNFIDKINEGLHSLNCCMLPFKHPRNISVQIEITEKENEYIQEKLREHWRQTVTLGEQISFEDTNVSNLQTPFGKIEFKICEEEK